MPRELATATVLCVYITGWHASLRLVPGTVGTTVFIQELVIILEATLNSGLS